MNFWLLFIILHAACGVASFTAGLLLLSKKRASWRYALPVFCAGLIGLTTFMVSAMASHWTEISGGERGAYIGLSVLSLYMLYRAYRARRAYIASNRTGNYVDDIGFSLIALFDGFTIVALIDLHAPAWLVVIGAVGAIVAGHFMIERKKRQFARIA